MLKKKTFKLILCIAFAFTLVSSCKSTSSTSAGTIVSAKPSASSHAKATDSLITREGIQHLSPDAFKRHLKFLSGEELKGRFTGSKGQKTAAQYIADQFKSYMLSPMGDSGSFFQPFILEQSSVDTNSSVMLPSGQMYRSGRDFLPRGKPRNEKIDSLLVLPNPTYDSTLFATLGNKFVLTFSSSEKGNDIFYSEVFDALRQKAKGLFVVPPSDSAFDFIHARMLQRKAHVSLPHPEEVSKNILILSREMARNMMGDSSHALNTKDKDATPFVKENMNIRIISNASVDTLRTENVCGFLQGESDTTIVVSAHYDHLGVDEEGNVFNGADDNASGVSALLSIAETFAKHHKTPKKSILFVCFTAEEVGLMGSEFFADVKPTIPLNKIMTNINIDMIGRTDDIYKEQSGKNYVYAIGSDKIAKALDDELVLANKQTENIVIDYLYNAEDHPMNIYRRSDHYNFAKHGIPVVFLFRGLHPDYHQITDDYERISFETISSVSRLIYRLLWNLTERTIPLVPAEQK